MGEPAPEELKFRGLDTSVVDALIALAKRLAGIAESGEDLIGVGELWAALSKIEDELPEINVELCFGFRRGNDACEDGLFYSLRVSDEEIRLDSMITTWSSAVGSDHESKVMARAVSSSDPQGQGFEGCPKEWLSRIQEVVGAQDLTLTVSRDH